jgi:phosphoglycerol transferase MdoB-like AlkP superfamily enzyme
MTKDDRWQRVALRWVAAFALLALSTWMFDRWSLDVELFSRTFSYGFFAQAILTTLLLAALLVVTNRLLVSFVISMALIGAVYVINVLKIRYLASPLGLSDYYVLKSLRGDSLGLYLDYINGKAVIVVLLALLLTLGLLWRKDRPVFQERMLQRLLALVAVVATGYVVLAGQLGQQIYSADRLGIAPYSSFLSQFHSGLLSNLVYARRELVMALDEPIDDDAVKKLRVQMQGVDRAAMALPHADRPDVVVIQSESFFNPDIIEQVGDTRAMLPNLHRAMEEGASGSMAVPTFGGGTLRTEFEVLTGIPLAAYPRLQFPYLQISRSSIPGMTRAFADAGYQVVAVHGNSGDFWNRRNAFRSLGFERFVTAKDFDKAAHRDGWFLSDRSMTDEVMKVLATDDAPKFVFAISIEAHGPFLKSPVNQESLRGRLLVPDGFSKNAREEYSRYAYHIADADQELGRLWDYLKQRGRPFVLVFYGDHLPGFEYVYQGATFHNGQDPDKQRVPWVAVVTYVPRGQRSLYSWMLPHEVLSLAGIHSPAYLSLAAAVGSQVIDDKAPNTLVDNDMLDGLYSAARMDLNGQFDMPDGVAGHAL